MDERFIQSYESDSGDPDVERLVRLEEIAQALYETMQDQAEANRLTTSQLIVVQAKLNATTRELGETNAKLEQLSRRVEELERPFVDALDLLADHVHPTPIGDTGKAIRNRFRSSRAHTIRDIRNLLNNLLRR